MFTVGLFDQKLRRRGRVMVPSGSVVIRRNGVGTFTLDMVGSPIMNRLAPGWHVAIFDPEGRQIMSGMPNQHRTESKTGVVTRTVSGRSHLGWVADMITLPTPSSPADQQADTAYWRDTGTALDVAARLVESHVGAKAHARWRRPITMHPETGGKKTKVETRFQPLLDEVRSILGDDHTIHAWLEDGAVHIGYSTPKDLRRRVRLSEASGGVTGWTLEQTAPTVTDVLVAGQGQGTARELKLMSGNPNEWGTTVLQFQDRRDTEDPDELVKAGEDTLAEGQEQASVVLETTTGLHRRLFTDFQIGDTITVTLAPGVEVQDIVQSAQIDWGADGVKTTLQVGPVQEELDAPGWVSRARNISRQLRRITAV